MRTWRNAAPVTFATRSTTPQSTSAIGMLPSPLIWQKKRAEGKHYNVAISHAAKKLVRLIFALQRSGQPYCPAA